MFFKVLQINQLIELCSRKCRWHFATLCFHSAYQVPLQGLCCGWWFASHGTSVMWGGSFKQWQWLTRNDDINALAKGRDDVWRWWQGDKGSMVRAASSNLSYHLFYTGPRAIGFICLFRVVQQTIRSYLLGDLFFFPQMLGLISLHLIS